MHGGWLKFFMFTSAMLYHEQMQLEQHLTANSVFDYYYRRLFGDILAFIYTWRQLLKHVCFYFPECRMIDGLVQGARRRKLDLKDIKQCESKLHYMSFFQINLMSYWHGKVWLLSATENNYVLSEMCSLLYHIPENPVVTLTLRNWRKKFGLLTVTAVMLFFLN